MAHGLSRQTGTDESNARSSGPKRIDISAAEFFRWTIVQLGDGEREHAERVTIEYLSRRFQTLRHLKVVSNLHAIGRKISPRFWNQLRDFGICRQVMNQTFLNQGTRVSFIGSKANCFR
jgi:hypothetical protein